MSATLVLRTVKGSPLTNYEVDNNFSNLNIFGDVVSANVGVLTSLSTGAKGNIVVAINEVYSNIGILSSLTTTAKTNIVAAINEIASESTTNVNITGGSISGVTFTGNTIGIAYGGTGSTTASDARTALGVAIGSNVQAWSTYLDTISGLARTDGNFIVGNGTTWVAESGATARTSLGLGTISTQDSTSVAITGGTITGLSNLTGANATFSGNISSGGIVSAVDFNSTSDIALKDNIQPITNPLDIINRLNGIQFDWKSNGSHAYGLSAQDVEKVLPDIVKSRDDGNKGINYINIIAFLIEAVKELSSEIKQLKQ